jgi:hypothetical protein
MTTLIMNKDYYAQLQQTYDHIPLKDIPEPVKGVCMDAESYDYRSYYTQRWNTAADKVIAANPDRHTIKEPEFTKMVLEVG